MASTPSHLVPPEMVHGQIEAAWTISAPTPSRSACWATADIALAVAEALADDNAMPLVLDPVLVSTSGTRLLDVAGIEILESRLIPRATLVTPNLPEAEALVGIRRASAEHRSATRAGFRLLGRREYPVQGRPWRRRHRCAMC